VKKRIGILTYRGEKGFNEPGFLRRLVREGKEMGAEVFVFSPQDVNAASRRIKGFTPGADGWKSGWYAWPDIVIDRYRYYPIEKHKNYLPFRNKNWFRYANSRFANKFRVHQVLMQEEELQRWLPETRLYRREELADMLKRHGVVYVKPTNGSGGRSILRVERRGKVYLLRGRTKNQGRKNAVLPTLSALTTEIERWTNREKYGEEQFFLQQGLDLALLPGRTVDARLLIQKDGSGKWRLTGVGMRIGPKRSSTSNLHGGGTAVPAGRFLAFRFGVQEAERILCECRELALKTVEKIEKHFGSMMEFGFDLGIDANGRVWIIEINPKPGRDIFRKLGQWDRYLQAVRRPLEYALYLAANDRIASRTG
jgi:hypothetical protein